MSVPDEEQNIQAKEGNIESEKNEALEASKITQEEEKKETGEEKQKTDEEKKETVEEKQKTDEEKQGTDEEKQETGEEKLETDEENKDSLPKNDIPSILKKIRDLPSEALELKMPTVNARESKEVYSKLCKALKTPENSIFFTNMENETKDFSYQCLGPVGIITLTKAFVPCNTIKILDLRYNKLGAKSIPAIISLIDQNESITHLNLSSNEIGKGSAHVLSELISKCYSVEFLDLSNNNLGDEELEKMGMALMQMDNVKELFLNDNDFSSERMATFGPCINKCSALLTLDLSGCHLEEGVSDLFRGLKLSNMTVLNLARNGIPNVAVHTLASALKTNRSLQELDLSYNALSKEGAIAIASGLKGSTTLEILRLAHNPIAGSAATKLLGTAGSNLKLLDLSGIRVSLGFFKLLRTYFRHGRELKVLFGSTIRYDCFQRDLTVIHVESLTRDNVVDYLQQLADDKGISLRNSLKIMHANFIEEQYSRLVGDVPGKGKKGDKGKKEKKKGKKKSKAEAELPRPEMTKEEFIFAMSSSPNFHISKTAVKKVSELVSDDGETVNMFKLLSRVRYKPDDLNIKIKEPKKPPPKDKKKGKKK